MAPEPVQGNRVDFEKLRKQRQRKQTIKRLIVLAVILAAIGGVISAGRMLVDADATVYVGDFVGAMGGDGYPIAIPGGIVRDIGEMGGNLAVLNDTNLYLYNKKGKTVANVQQMTDYTAFAATSDRLLIYDIGGTRYQLRSTTRNLLEKNSEYNIQGAALGLHGEYALITGSEQSASRVAVFDRKNQLMFELLSENLIVDVAISPKGTRLAVGGVSAQGGQLYSMFWLYDLGVQDDAIVRLEFLDELVLDVQYLSDGRISVVTDKAYRLLSADGKEDATYLFAGRQLQALERKGKQALLLLADGPDTRLVLLDSLCREQATILHEGGKVRDIALSDNRVYVLDDRGITTYNTSLEWKNLFEMRGISRIRLVGDKLFYLGKEEINILTS